MNRIVELEKPVKSAGSNLKAPEQLQQWRCGCFQFDDDGINDRDDDTHDDDVENCDGRVNNALHQTSRFIISVKREKSFFIIMIMIVATVVYSDIIMVD